MNLLKIVGGNTMYVCAVAVFLETMYDCFGG